MKTFFLQGQASFPSLESSVIVEGIVAGALDNSIFIGTCLATEIVSIFRHVLKI